MLKHNLIWKLSEIHNNKTPLGNTISSSVFYMYPHLGHGFSIQICLQVSLDVMCALKFHIILVKDKYKMAAIWFFFKFEISLFYLTVHRNNGHQAQFELCFIKKKLYYIKHDKKWQNTKWPPSVWKCVHIDTKKKQVKKIYQHLWYQLTVLSGAFT